MIWVFLLYPFLELFTLLWSIFESWRWFLTFHFIFVDCSPGGAECLAWKAMSSHFAGTVITFQDFLRLIFRNSFYAFLCGRSVFTTLVLLNFNFSTFISLANFNSFTSCEGASFSWESFFLLFIRYTVKRWSPPCLIFVYIIAVSAGVVSPGFCTFSLNSF